MSALTLAPKAPVCPFCHYRMGRKIERDENGNYVWRWSCRCQVTPEEMQAFIAGQVAPIEPQPAPEPKAKTTKAKTQIPVTSGAFGSKTKVEEL